MKDIYKRVVAPAALLGALGGLTGCSAWQSMNGEDVFSQAEKSSINSVIQPQALAMAQKVIQITESQVKPAGFSIKHDDAFPEDDTKVVVSINTEQDTINSHITIHLSDTGPILNASSVSQIEVGSRACPVVNGPCLSDRTINIFAPGQVVEPGQKPRKEWAAKEVSFYDGNMDGVTDNGTVFSTVISRNFAENDFGNTSATITAQTIVQLAQPILAGIFE